MVPAAGAAISAIGANFLRRIRVYLLRSKNIALIQPLTPKTLDRFLKGTSFLPFIAEQAEGIVEAILEGKGSYTISEKSLEKLFEENIAYIVEQMGIPLDEENYHLLVEEMEYQAIMWLD